MRFVSSGFCFCFCLLGSFFMQAAGVDSVRTIVTPVQCYGLRDGSIKVDFVYGGTKPYYYSIDGQSYTTNPFFDRLWGGTYVLYVRDATGATKDWLITVKEPFKLDVNLVASVSSILPGEALDLRAIASVESEFLDGITWLPSTFFSQQDTLRQLVSISEPTEFYVTVRDHNGCTATDSLIIGVEKAKLYFPNVINPESTGDNYFTVFSGEGVRRVLSLQVYSRAGALVFERTDFEANTPALGWNGRWKDSVVQAGVYTYLAIVEYSDGKQQRFDGTVTVIR